MLCLRGLYPRVRIIGMIIIAKTWKTCDFVFIVWMPQFSDFRSQLAYHKNFFPHFLVIYESEFGDNLHLGRVEIFLYRFVAPSGSFIFSLDFCGCSLGSIGYVPFNYWADCMHHILMWLTFPSYYFLPLIILLLMRCTLVCSVVRSTDISHFIIMDWSIRQFIS